MPPMPRIDARALQIVPPLSTGSAALRHREFRLLAIATFISIAGSWMQEVTTAWLIYQITGSMACLGADAFACGNTSVLLLAMGGEKSLDRDRK